MIKINKFKKYCFFSAAQWNSLSIKYFEMVIQAVDSDGIYFLQIISSGQKKTMMTFLIFYIGSIFLFRLWAKSADWKF